MTEAYHDFMRRHKLSYDTDVARAFAVAEEAHKGQLRRSGEPFFTHPLAVADIIAGLGLDSTTIMGGVLHDVVEDTDVTLEDIENSFSPEIAQLVDGVTKLSKYDFNSAEEQQAETLRKMFLAMAQDIRVVIIKLADRLHNMKTLNFQSQEKRIEKAKETLDIYAPLAHRLGMNNIKCELEDLSLRYLEPDAYYEIANKISATRKERESQLLNVIDRIEDQLAEMHIKADIEGRPKHIYSIYRKMHDKDKTFEEVYDLIAIRVIVSNIRDCYGVLGIVHTMWKPIPNRFKDYVAVPKPNMYQSLHTTVLGDDGKPFEVQIRTYEMHRTAEYGIAAHWQYKEKSRGRTELDEKLAWLRELMEWQNDIKDSREFMEKLKIDVFSEYVLVFTPKGEVKEFAAGATPLDFAYSIHSDIGNKCIGARVNGKSVSLDYELKTGDIVEILTGKTPGPSRDWLNKVKTQTARAKIKQWFKRGLRDENVAVGRREFDREANRQGYRAKDLLRPEWIQGLLRKFTLKSEEDMFASIGYGAITVHQVLNKLIEQYRNANGLEDDHVRLRVAKKGHSDGRDRGETITVQGMPGMTARFGKCCNPLPGDEIIGYITSKHELVVHTKNCKNLLDSGVDRNKFVEVEWAGDPEITYEVELQIVAEDRKGLVVEVAQAVSSPRRDITGLTAHASKNGLANISVRCNISTVRELESLMAKLRGLRGIRSVSRYYGT